MAYSSPRLRTIVGASARCDSGESRNPDCKYSRRGFTLVEMMVVIGILSILVTVLAVAVFGVFSKSAESETKMKIETLKSGIERFNAAWSFFPFASLYRQSMAMGSKSRLMPPNQTNEGIESLVMALRTRNSGGPFIENEYLQDYNCNWDNDEITENFANIEGALTLFEIRDGWDNPLVYVNLAELTPEMKAVPISAMKADGTIETIDLNELEAKLLDPVTQIKAAKAWCIWSFGEDGINDYGRGDDITSWIKIPDEDEPEVEDEETGAEETTEHE